MKLGKIIINFTVTQIFSQKIIWRCPVRIYAFSGAQCLMENRSNDYHLHSMTSREKCLMFAILK